jgi:hypothetical protein
LEDLIVAYARHQDVCAGAHEVTDMLLPIKEYTWLSTKKVSTYSDKTILMWLVENLPFLSAITNVHKVPEMKNFYSSTNECFVLYNKSPECMEIKIPQEIFFLPPQEHGFGQRVLAGARCGGLHVHYPKSVDITYGI